MEPRVRKAASRGPDSARRDRPAKPDVQRPKDTGVPEFDMGRPREPGEPPEPDEADGTAEHTPRDPDERAPEKSPAKNRRSDLADVGEADGQRG